MKTLSRIFRQNAQTSIIILALVGIWLIFTVLAAVMKDVNFLSPQNISNIFRQMTITAIMATGMVFVIVTGGIDLSVGKLAGFVSTVVAYNQAYRFTDNPAVAAMASVVIGLAVGLLWGGLQGYIISYLRVPAFIVTLGSMFILGGLTLLQTEGQTITATQPYFREIGQGYLNPILGWLLAAIVTAAIFFLMFRDRRNKQKYGFPLPALQADIIKSTLFAALLWGYVFVVNQYNGVQVPVLLLGIVAVIMTYVSNNTRFGRYTYAIGGNREAARLSGINIRQTLFLVFVLMGFLSGLAGIMLASYVGYGTIGAGSGYELDVIAAAILGGTSTLGGVGTIPGALIGALIMASLNTGLQILDVAPAWQGIAKGIVLILAVLLDVYFKKERN
ncbi:Xylose transport system permease protein XylH [Thermoflexales bacterium]|nr:Xylose transport system permease protein XylH [Thermoflexales bacterium]